MTRPGLLLVVAFVLSYTFLPAILCRCLALRTSTIDEVFGLRALPVLLDGDLDGAANLLADLSRLPGRVPVPARRGALCFDNGVQGPLRIGKGLKLPELRRLERVVDALPNVR